MSAEIKAMTRLTPQAWTLNLSKKLARLSPAFAGKKLRQPFFLIGCARSGTTMLQNLLAARDDLAVFPAEATYLWHPSTYPWTKATVDVPPIWMAPSQFSQISWCARTREDNERIRASFGAYQFFSGAPRFLNKNAMIAFMIPQVLELFPDARLIHLVRDGRAVATSFAVKQHKKIVADRDLYRRKGYALEFDSLLEKTSECWKEHILEVEGQKERLGLERNGAMLELRYEDLCDDPRRHLRAVEEFMGLRPNGFSPERLFEVKSVNHKYRERLAPETIQRIEEIMQPALRLKGYLA